MATGVTENLTCVHGSGPGTCGSRGPMGTSFTGTERRGGDYASRGTTLLGVWPMGPTTSGCPVSTSARRAALAAPLLFVTGTGKAWEFLDITDPDALEDLGLGTEGLWMVGTNEKPDGAVYRGNGPSSIRSVQGRYRAQHLGQRTGRRLGRPGHGCPSTWTGTGWTTLPMLTARAGVVRNLSAAGR